MAEMRPPTVDEVEKLIRAGDAEPLMPGYFPVPVLLQGRWWHLPQGRDVEADPRYELASPSLADLFTGQHERLAAAQAAIGRTTSSPPGRRP